MSKKIEKHGWSNLYENNSLAIFHTINNFNFSVSTQDKKRQDKNFIDPFLQQ
jgi:hypothetical protein